MKIKYFTWIVLFAGFIINFEVLSCSENLDNEFGVVLGEKLIDAVYDENLSKIKKLISQGASVNQCDEYGNSVLKIATERCNLPIIQYFIENGASIKSNLLRTMVVNCRPPSRFKIIKYLVTQKTAISDYDNEGFIAAAEVGDIEVIKYLITKGFKVNEKGKGGTTALMGAAEHSHKEIFNYLVTQGATITDEDETGETVLMYASQGASQEIVEFLVHKGVDIHKRDREGKTAFMYACESGRFESAKFLMSQGKIDLNEKDKNGNTVFITMAVRDDIEPGSYEFVKFLKESGANINEVNAQGNNALMEKFRQQEHWWATKDEREMRNKKINYLIESGIDLKHINKAGESVLHERFYPPKNNRLDLDTDEIKKIIEKGVPLNVRNKDGRTFLMIALKDNSWAKLFMDGQNISFLDFTKYLVEKGLDLNVKDNEGKTLLMYARKYREMDQALIQYLAQKEKKQAN